MLNVEEAIEMRLCGVKLEDPNNSKDCGGYTLSWLGASQPMPARDQKAVTPDRLTTVSWLLPLLVQILASGIIALVLSVYDYGLANIQRV